MEANKDKELMGWYYELLAGLMVIMPIIICMISYILFNETGLIIGIIFGGIWFYYWSWKI